MGNILGALVGWRRDTKLDRAVLTLALGFSQIPFYVLAVILALVFGYILAWLPAYGGHSSTLYPSLTLEFILSAIEHTILPSLSIVITSLFGWVISMRAMLITVLGEDYLLFAQAKGLRKTRIFNRYAFRNALLPQVTGLAMSLGFIFGGALIVEKIFAYPGVGFVFAMALNWMDYNTINACLITTIFTVLTANLLIDLLYPLIDPRIQY
jgi:peptide/nickel transport system permease protein